MIRIQEPVSVLHSATGFILRAARINGMVNDKTAITKNDRLMGWVKNIV